MVHALRAQLGAVLPSYMVPAAFVLLSALPLTPNGKLDRAALPAPDADAVQQRDYSAPIGDAEQALASIWQTLLNVERVGRDDHFFELGGHSLLVMQLVLGVRERCGVELPVAAVFERPQLWALAETVAALQIDTYLGADLAQMQAELDGLSEAELLELLQREAVDE